MNRGDWQAAVHGVAKSQRRLKQLSMHADGKNTNKNVLTFQDIKPLVSA